MRHRLILAKINRGIESSARRTRERVATNHVVFGDISHEFQDATRGASDSISVLSAGLLVSVYFTSLCPVLCRHFIRFQAMLRWLAART